MSTTIADDLHGTDTKDTYETSKVPRTYNYKLKVWDGGHLRFKIEYYCPVLLGESGDGHWYTLEERSRISSGTTLEGSFTMPAVKLSSTTVAEKTTVKFIFSRGVLTEGVSYELYFEYV